MTPLAARLVVLVAALACVRCVREAPHVEAPAAEAALSVRSAAPLPVAAPSGVSCHRTAFHEPPPAEVMDAALSKLAALEARASATFDVSAKKPIITGSAVDVFGREGRPAGTWDGLVAQAAELDAAFRELRPTAAIAARALVDVGAVYDALASALMAWTPPPYSPFTAAQLAKLNQSGRNQLTALAAGVAANFAASIEQRRIAQAAAMRGNAYIAYLGALELTAMMPTIDSGLRSTALRRLEALLGDADRALATTSRADPTSDSLSCRLDLNAVIRDP